MDPYVYPGTNVLRNLRDIRDAEKLSKAEGIATARRIVELARDPIQRKFDALHLQAITGTSFRIFTYGPESSVR